MYVLFVFSCRKSSLSSKPAASIMHCEFTPASHGLRRRTRMAGANGGKLALLPCMLAGPLAGKTQRSQQRLPAPVVFFSSDPGILAAPIKDGAGDAAEGMLTAASQIFRRPQPGTLSLRNPLRASFQAPEPSPTATLRGGRTKRGSPRRGGGYGTSCPLASEPLAVLSDSDSETRSRRALNARTVLASLPQMPGVSVATVHGWHSSHV